MSPSDLPIDLAAVQAIFARRLPLYARRAPVYQTTMLNELARLWEGHERVLDLGAGTGVVGEAIQVLLGSRVTSIDVQDRFVTGLPTTTMTYEGSSFPFPAGSFDAVVINNVLHHVPMGLRAGLLVECHRVCAGPVYIKDHIAASALDHARLAALDLIGNLPFSGMVSARYLTENDWRQLRQVSGYEEDARSFAKYRSSVTAAVFPNRLEVVMKWRPAPAVSSGA